MDNKVTGKGAIVGALGNEGGFMIVLSLLILFSLTVLGLTSMFNATIQTKIAGNENFASQALYAADAGLNQALTQLNTNVITISSSDYSDPDWCHPPDSSPDVKTEGDGDYTVVDLSENRTLYRWYMHFKTDTQDQDGDSNTTELVYFNNAFGYPSSLFSGAAGDEGYPVIEVRSEGFVLAVNDRIAERRLGLELGRNQFNVEAQGSLTSNSSVDVTGNIDVSGMNHDLEGNLGGSCGADMPGIFVENGKTVSISGSGSIDGSPPSLENDGSVVLPATPWDVLGIDQSDIATYFDIIDADASGYSLSDLSGNVLVRNIIPPNDLSITSNLTLGGILIVHNDNFHPATWNASNPSSPDYSPNPGDPYYDDYVVEADSSVPASYDSSYAPAEFTFSGTGTYQGVIIADSVVKLSGNPTIIGAIISLGPLGIQNMGTGNADIFYSCEAITQFTTRGYSTKLVWHQLYD